jgi:hypothetical protein
MGCWLDGLTVIVTAAEVFDAFAPALHTQKVAKQTRNVNPCNHMTRLLFKRSNSALRWISADYRPACLRASAFSRVQSIVHNEPVEG